MPVEGKEVEADEYESDPEDAIALSAMRRREASDEEEEDGGDGGRRRDWTAEIGSDGEFDEQGVAPSYEDDEEQEDYDEEYEEEIEDEIVDEEEVEERDLESSRRKEEEDGEEKGEEEEKKENEPYAVPTAGAFYMHDDRFQEKGRGRGRSRHMLGGRRVRENKDDHAWVHDRFEEMKLQDAQHDRGRRNSRGRFRGRGGGNNRGTGRGFVKGNNRPRAYYDDVNNQNRDGSNLNRDSNNRNRPQKSVRGRGPRHYEAISRNNEVYAHRREQSQESQSSTDAGRLFSQTSNMQYGAALQKKNVFASNLNSASPPFYPSSSSKQDGQFGNASKIISSPMNMENNYLSSQSGSMLRGKAVVTAQMHSPGSPLTSTNTTHSSQSRVQGRSLNITSQSNYKSTAPVIPVPRVPQQIQAPITQQNPQPQFQPAVRVSSQQMAPTIRNQASPPHAPTTNLSEVGDTGSPPDSNNLKPQLIAKGKTGSYGAEKSSFLYNGAQVIGTSGAIGGQNDQNFPGTPALLPVMQFGGQHHNGIPAVGMALPGYVAQPQLGFGNSEMTWIPVLAGAAGALGSSYSYIALDGSYYPRPSGQTSSAIGSGKESSAPKPATLKPEQRTGIVNDGLEQRLNRPRRYSEMNFGQ